MCSYLIFLAASLFSRCAKRGSRTIMRGSFSPPLFPPDTVATNFLLKFHIERNVIKNGHHPKNEERRSRGSKILLLFAFLLQVCGCELQLYLPAVKTQISLQCFNMKEANRDLPSQTNYLSIQLTLNLINKMDVCVRSKVLRLLLPSTESSEAFI